VGGEAVTVPAGTFKEAIVVETRTRSSRASGEVLSRVWYAKDVGPVKILAKTAKSTIILELEKVVQPAAGSGTR
jgi:hypothetical protein